VQEADPDRGRHGNPGKSTRTLGDRVRERGLGELVTEIRENTRIQLEPHTGVKESCRLSGINRSTHYRSRNRNQSDPATPVRTPPPNRLESEEREHIIAVLNSTRFRDKAPRQVWATLLDESTYLCSVATMYHLLRER